MYTLIAAGTRIQTSLENRCKSATFLRPRQLPRASNYHRAGSRDARIRGATLLDAARIAAAPDLEETIHAPAGVPAVRHKPIVDAVLRPPTHGLHGVAALGDELVKVLLVNAALVGHEALVDLEGHLDGALGHDLLLHAGRAVDGVDAAGLDLGAAPRLAVGTLLGARGSRAVARRIWEAGVRDDAGVLQVRPSAGEPATVAAHVAAIATDHVLGRQHRRGPAACDGHAVAEHLRGREGPATAATLLIADGMDQARPLRHRIELCGDLGLAVVGPLRQDLIQVVRDVRELGAQERPGVLEGHTLEEGVHARDPGGLIHRLVQPCDLIQVVDQSLAMDGTSTARAHKRKGDGKRALHG
mmetsp:Transcript_82889/g.210951  ORF Transcript_82889/g.210951 Transcript_82889/m.210951 type:complete len:357 (-) Transcript_82889:56-1126(-)